VDQVDVVIVGAGVVGLAAAVEITNRFNRFSVTILERHTGFGQETSSRNSEVIHAGIYYPSQSLKASLCVEGNRKLYRFCESSKISCRRTGKLILARSDSDLPHLQALYLQAAANGVTDLQWLDQKQVLSLEPHARSAGALFSPSTGIVDSHQLMSRLEYLAKQNGALPAYRHEVIGLDPLAEGYRVAYRNPDGTFEALRCRWLVNCAGLAADRVAAMLGIDPAEAGYQIFPCKGEYFSVPYAKAGMVKRLIYPPPLAELTGLGIHATKTLDGRLRLGPNAVYVDSLDYRVDPGHAADFYGAIKEILPFLELSDLEPEMAGIRPKLQGKGQPFRDFVVCHEAGRGLPGVVNLIGIESPGLTACLSLAEMVAEFID
jgi:L-2-hydroxyglutarate oxidase LhgO